LVWFEIIIANVDCQWLRQILNPQKTSCNDNVESRRWATTATVFSAAKLLATTKPAVHETKLRAAATSRWHGCWGFYLSHNIKTEVEMLEVKVQRVHRYAYKNIQKYTLKHHWREISDIEEKQSKNFITSHSAVDFFSVATRRIRR